MPSVTQSYPLKLPQDPEFRQRVEWLMELTAQAGHHLLKSLWTEDWIDQLESSSKKAYKVIGDHQVQFRLKGGQKLYLPSRIRRSIAEQVGRILRSQTKRKNCYYDVLKVVQVLGVEGRLDALVRIVGWTLSRLYGKYYRWALIRQTLRTFRRYYYQLGRDLTVLTQIPYTTQVKPTLRNWAFPYAPDDGQTLRFTWQGNLLPLQMKLPTTPHPTTTHEWAWYDLALALPAKLLHRISPETAKVQRPTLRYLILKSGLKLPFLEFAWTLQSTPEVPLKGERVLATDLGLVNLTTSVVIEAGSQISPPMFWSPESARLQRIEYLYHHLANLQRKLDRYPTTYRGQGRRGQERNRLYRKLNRYREELLHWACNQLLETAVQWHCQTIVLEDLRTYEPPTNKRKLSRKLSNWLRGALYELLLYKAKRVGITLKRVSPYWTSTYCPRCGEKGLKITDARRLRGDKKGRMFHCPTCVFLADRDYMAALNIYRMYQESRNKRYSLKHAKPVPYMATGIPPNCPGGASTSSLRAGG